MATCGAFGFIINNEEKITQSFSGSTPANLGRDILFAISKIEDFSTFRNNVESIKMVDGNDKPTHSVYEKSDAGLINSLLGIEVEGFDCWHSLLHHSQDYIKHYFNINNPLPYMMDSKGFLYDSLECEYAYIINLDTNMIEFYVGYNHDLHAEGRYACPPCYQDHEGEPMLDTLTDFAGVVKIVELSLPSCYDADKESIELFIHVIIKYIEDMDEGIHSGKPPKEI